MSTALVLLMVFAGIIMVLLVFAGLLSYAANKKDRATVLIGLAVVLDAVASIVVGTSVGKLAGGAAFLGGIVISAIAVVIVVVTSAERVDG